MSGPGCGATAGRRAAAGVRPVGARVRVRRGAAAERGAGHGGVLCHLLAARARSAGQARRALDQGGLQGHGRSVQVDLIKLKLKPPGTKRLKLNCDILLSTSAFKLNLRRYSMVHWDLPTVQVPHMLTVFGGAVGRGLHSSTSRLNAIAFCGIGCTSRGSPGGVQEMCRVLGDV